MSIQIRFVVSTRLKTEFIENLLSVLAFYMNIFNPVYLPRRLLCIRSVWVFQWGLLKRTLLCSWWGYDVGCCWIHRGWSENCGEQEQPRHKR